MVNVAEGSGDGDDDGAGDAFTLIAVGIEVGVLQAVNRIAHRRKKLVVFIRSSYFSQAIHCNSISQLYCTLFYDCLELLTAFQRVS